MRAPFWRQIYTSEYRDLYGVAIGKMGQVVGWCGIFHTFFQVEYG